MAKIEVVFDTETTGTDAAVDKLVEIAGTSTSPDFHDFSSLVNPERDIPAEAKGVHHITEDDVKHCPIEIEAVSQFVDNFGGDASNIVLVAHNSKFDKSFMDRIIPAATFDYVCTMKSAMTIWPDAPSYKNQSLRYWLNLKVDVPDGLFPHRALYDAIVTKAIFEELLRHKPLEDLINITKYPILLPKVPIGKHKGATWREVPSSYLDWIVNKSDIEDENILHTAHHWLRAKQGGRRY